MKFNFYCNETILYLKTEVTSGRREGSKHETHIFISEKNSKVQTIFWTTHFKKNTKNMKS